MRTSSYYYFHYYYIYTSIERRFARVCDRTFIPIHVATMKAKIVNYPTIKAAVNIVTAKSRAISYDVHQVQVMPCLPLSDFPITSRHS